MALLETKGISVRFGGLTAVKEVSLAIEPGERVALIGPNGAGKTTFFNVLTGQLKPSAGSVHFKDVDITSHSVFSRAHMGMARSFQITSLFPNETVLVNTLIALQGTRRGRYGLVRYFKNDRTLRRDAQQLLESVDLWDLREARVSSLAYGLQRKLEITLPLASQPDLLLLDEPSCGLTTVESADITTRVRQLGSKLTVLMIAHDMDLVFGVAERVILLHYGQIACEGTCDEIRANPMVREIYMGNRKSLGGTV